MNSMVMIVMMMVVVGCNWKEGRQEGRKKEGKAKERKTKERKGKEVEVFLGDDSSLAVTAPLLLYSILIF